VDGRGKDVDRRAAQLARSGGGRRMSATRADVARLAGVSTAVVSYVVNDGPRPVAAETAARVRDAIERLGYRPNASAQALRRGSTGLLGLVVSDSTNPYFAQYTAELITAATARGNRVLVADSFHDQRPHTDIVGELISQQVDGLLFHSSFAGLDRHHALVVAGIPTVLIDCPGPVPGRRTVGTNAHGAAEMLVNHLVGHGRRRIAMVVGDGGFGDPDPRETGWRRGLQAARLPEAALVRVPWSREGGYSAAATVLAADPATDAIFASNDMQAIGLVRALHELGVRVPDDIAVVSYDGTRESEFCWPPLTVARQPLPKLAQTALELLDEPETRAGIHRQFDTELVRRNSCGCTPEDVDRTPTELVTRDRSGAGRNP